MSQGDLMDVMDTDRETISRYENGNREMTISTLFQFAEALEIDPGELMPDVYAERKSKQQRLNGCMKLQECFLKKIWR